MLLLALCEVTTWVFQGFDAHVTNKIDTSGTFEVAISHKTPFWSF